MANQGRVRRSHTKAGTGFLRLQIVFLLSVALFGMVCLSSQLPAVEAHDTLDQKNDQNPWISPLDSCGYPGQTFTPSADNITGFDMNFAAGYSVSFTISPYPGNPLTSFGPFTTTGGFQHFDLPNQVPLSPGVKYVIRFGGCPQA